MTNHTHRTRVTIGIGGFLALAVPSVYFFLGFHPLLVLAWLLAIACISLALSHSDTSLSASPGIERRDVLIGLALAALFAPLYLLSLERIPFQIGTDELVHIYVERRLTSLSNPDVFGVDADLFYFPSGSFLVNGFLAKMLGGITLQNVRLVHGLFGVAIVFCGFLFFRLLSPRGFAIGTTMLLASSHVLIGLSRMAMRENICLLLELIAFTVLISGVRSIQVGKLFLGGSIMGLGVYTYFAARIVPLVWVFYLVMLCSVRMQDRSRMFFRLAIPVFAGFLVSAGPMFIANWKAPSQQYDYPNQVTILTPEGRQLVRQWENPPNPDGALLRNVLNGLSAFNRTTTDKGHIYVNPGHGFLDPLTGVLLWVGVASMLLRRQPHEREILALSGLVMIWLPLSLLTTKNPSYTRLLVILPFIAIFAMEGATSISKLLIKALTAFRCSLGMKPHAMVTVAVGLIVFWNISIYGEYVATGLMRQEGIGASMRYVTARQNQTSYHYYVLDEQVFWFSSSTWTAWLGLFTNPTQRVELVKPDFLNEKMRSNGILLPATVLMSTRIWASSGEQLRQQYPTAVVHPIDALERFVAVEIL